MDKPKLTLKISHTIDGHIYATVHKWIDVYTKIGIEQRPPLIRKPRRPTIKELEEILMCEDATK